VARHLYLCRRAARKFIRSGLERGDLEQVAAIGLIKAARRFDPAAGTPFEAYAWITIVGELMHHVRDFERPVRVPRRLRALEPHFARTCEALAARLGREPSDGEIASAMGVFARTVEELRGVREAAQPVALDDVDAARFVRRDEPALEDRLLVRRAFAALTVVERRVIAGTYVLGLTQRELSRRLGISAKCVSRLHRAALGSMQRACAG
jgi:RNA polymerase sigma-B factor